MADLFNVLAPDGDQPGAFGLSNDFYRNLAAFGASMATAANARNGQGFLTYGNGLAGPIGAGVLGAMDMSRQNQMARSQMASQQANTQGQLLQNQVLRMAMPYQEQLNRARTEWFTNPPQGPVGLDSGGTQPATGPKPLASDTSAPRGFRNNNALNLQFAGQPGATSDGRFAVFGSPEEGVAAAAAQLQRYGQRGLTTPMSIISTWAPASDGNDPQEYAATVQKMTGLAPNEPVNLADPLQLSRLIHGMSAVENGKPLDWDVINRGVQTALSGKPFQVASTGRDIPVPTQTAAAAPSAPAPTQVAQAAPTAAIPMPPQIAILRRNAAQNLAIAQQARRMQDPSAEGYEISARDQLKQASDIETAWQKAQIDMQTAYPIEANKTKAQAQFGMRDVRPGGVLFQGPNPVGQVPVKSDEIDANGGRISVFRNPLDGTVVGGGAVGSDGVPVGAVRTALPPGTETAIKGKAEEYVKESAKAYSSANATLGWAEQMQHAADTLNAGGGWSTTGPTNQGRMELARAVNMATDLFGLKSPFDPMKVASWEEFNKQTKTAGMQLVSSMFGASREAASVIQGATSAVPNAENSPMGGKLVLQAIVEASKNVMDKHMFVTNWLMDPRHGGNILGAEEAFNQQYPPSLYAKRAISSVQPYEVSSPDEMKRLLPGTLIRRKGSDQIKMVPGAERIELQQAQ